MAERYNKNKPLVPVRDMNFTMRERARICCEAGHRGHAPTAVKYGLGPKTISQWRCHYKEDKEFQGAMREFELEFKIAWAHELTDTLKQGIVKMSQLIALATEIGDLPNVMKAVQTLSEIEQVNRVIEEPASTYSAAQGRADEAPVAPSVEDDEAEPGVVHSSYDA